MTLLLWISGILSLLMIKSLFNKNLLVGFFFAFLQVYNFVPFASRCYNSELVDIVSHITLSSDSIIYDYLIFCYGQSVVLYVLFNILLSSSISKSTKCIFRPDNVRKNLAVYNIIQVIVGLFLSYNLLKSYSSLNYYDQTVVKSNVIWVMLMEYSFVFYLIDFLLYKKENKLTPAMFGLFIALPTFITLFKIGNRGIALPAMCGYLFMYLSSMNFKINIKQIKTIIIAAIGVLSIIGFSQFVRTNRGADSSSHLFSFDMIGEFFDISVLLFQDYTVPGNSLMYCIDKNIVDPLFVCKSNFCNAIFFLEHSTIAEDISNRINTGEVFGVGGFLPVEGYYLCGFLGIFVIPIVIVLFFRYYFRNLYTLDKQYNLFVGFLLCSFLCFNLVRGQSYLLFKVLYMYILPCCVLYRLAFGKLIGNEKN